MVQGSQKKIAAINDLTGYGRCALTVSMPVISHMKIQCCPVPTSILSNHTGYEEYFFDDYRIRNVNIAYNGLDEEIVIENDISRVIEQYTCGQNIVLQENINALLEKYSNDFSLCCLFVKAKTNISDKRDVFKELWEEIESIYRVNYEIEKSTAIIGKYYKLLCFISREM